ncbi:HTH domain-containing protein [Pseudescherichia vulneris]|uniref:helix-turn-helix transcriptional regulator n=1 Tax=Pseudescherichia vulneris TaxID=566 RepID=UPI0028D8C679|nr:HTH domain-containing protein [Pseudescherichia vulneris]
MSASGPNRAERLLNLLQILHRHRYPVSGTRLAEELAIGLRTLYRDIASLRAQGADIRGEAGTGYVLEEGYLLPPMMFSPEQLDALTLGLRWVTHYGDSALSKAAEENIADVLPARLQPYINHSTLLVGPTKTRGGNQNNFSLLRSAVRDESKIRVRYVDLHGEQTERIL